MSVGITAFTMSFKLHHQGHGVQPELDQWTWVLCLALIKMSVTIENPDIGSNYCGRIDPYNGTQTVWESNDWSEIPIQYK
jgi:hypothetical protein